MPGLLRNRQGVRLYRRCLAGTPDDGCNLLKLCKTLVIGQRHLHDVATRYALGIFETLNVLQKALPHGVWCF